MTSLLLSGASGSIGGNLLRSGRLASYDVNCISRSGKVVSPGKRVQNLILDLADENAAVNFYNQADIIVHAAAIVPKKATDVAEFAFNHAIAANISKIALANDVKHFILLSTGSVYGEKITRPNEKSRPLPEEPYGKSMLAMEYIISQKLHGRIPLTILRLFYPYGFDKLTPPDNLISKLLLRLNANQSFTIGSKADQSGFRPVLIDDVCSIVSKILTSKWSGVLNVAGPEEIKLREIINLMAQLKGVEKPLIETIESQAAPIDCDISLLSLLFPGLSLNKFQSGLATAMKRMELKAMNDTK